MKRISLAALALLALAPALPLHAQQAAEAEAEVAAVVRRLFDGMRAGDSTVVRSVFHPAARLMTTAVRDGQPVVRVDSIDAFVRAVGTPHEQVWDERIDGLEVRVDGPLATAWMRYTFYLGERLSHCGVNAFQLVRTAEGWKVAQVADTRRREGCPELPPARGR